jgi:hypothetical protein
MFCCAFSVAAACCFARCRSCCMVAASLTPRCSVRVGRRNTTKLFPRQRILVTPSGSAACTLSSCAEPSVPLPRRIAPFHSHTPVLGFPRVRTLSPTALRGRPSCLLLIAEQGVLEPRVGREVDILDTIDRWSDVSAQLLNLHCRGCCVPSFCTGGHCGRGRGAWDGALQFPRLDVKV